MADQLREGLGKLLDQYDARREAELAREKRTKEEDARFLSRFTELRNSVVRPVFEEAGAMLKERGHAFTISEDEFGIGEGGVREAGISFHIVPVGMELPRHEDDHTRTLSITTRHYNKTVWINSGKSQDAGGTAGAKGAHTLEKVDRQLIEDALIKFVGGIIGG
jgi:hypothetical protein